MPCISVWPCHTYPPGAESDAAGKHQSGSQLDRNDVFLPKPYVYNQNQYFCGTQYQSSKVEIMQKPYVHEQKIFNTYLLIITSLSPSIVNLFILGRILVDSKVIHVSVTHVDKNLQGLSPYSISSNPFPSLPLHPSIPLLPCVYTNLCVYIYIYIYICGYMCVFMHICMYMDVYI